MCARAFIGIGFLLLLPACLQVDNSVRHTAVVGDLVVEIVASNGNPKPNEKIKLRASVTNRGASTQTLKWANEPVLDIRVRFLYRDTMIVKRWSEDNPTALDRSGWQIKAGESRSIEMEWVADSRSEGREVDIAARFVYFPGSAVEPGVQISVGPPPIK